MGAKQGELTRRKKGWLGFPKNILANTHVRPDPYLGSIDNDSVLHKFIEILILDKFIDQITASRSAIVSSILCNFVPLSKTVLTWVNGYCKISWNSGV